MLKQEAHTMPPKRRKAVKDKEQPLTSIGLNITELTSHLETLSEPLTNHDILLLHQLLKVNNAASSLVARFRGLRMQYKCLDAYIMADILPSPETKSSCGAARRRQITNNIATHRRIHIWL